MEKSLLRKAAIQSVALMIAVITLSFAMKQYQMISIEASNIEINNTATGNDNKQDQVVTLDVEQSDQSGVISEDMPSTMDTPITNVKDLKSRIDESILTKLGDNFLVVKKPKGKDISLKLKDLYVKHSIQLNLTGIEATMTSDMIIRVRGDELFYGDPVYTEIKTLEIDEEERTSEEIITKDYGKDLSHGITIIDNKVAKNDNRIAEQLLIELDTVYAYIIYEDNNCYYIDLRKPSEVYDKILVIDAGHGGKDAGALSKGDKYYEKNINLSIVQELKKLLDKEDIKVYYTRTSDETVFLRPRVTLANAVDCDYFISIHCNANEESSPNGTEVLFYDNKFKGIKNRSLAALFSDELAKAIPLYKRGIVQKYTEDIFIMDKSVVPTILIEVGYLTNNKDMNYLSSEDNKKAVAQGIYNGILKAYEELPVTE